MKLFKVVFPVVGTGGFFGLGGYSYFSQKELDQNIGKFDFSSKVEFIGKLIFYKPEDLSHYKWDLLTDNEYNIRKDELNKYKKEGSDDFILLRVINSMNKSEAGKFLSENFSAKNSKSEIEDEMKNKKDEILRIFGTGILEQL